MNFALYTTGQKISGQHLHTGKQIDRDVAEDQVIRNSITWNTSAVNNSNLTSNVLSIYGFEGAELDSILGEQYSDLLNDNANTNNDGTLPRESTGEDQFQSNSEEEEAVIEDFHIPSSIEEEEEEEEYGEELGSYNDDIPTDEASSRDYEDEMPLFQGGGVTPGMDDEENHMQHGIEEEEIEYEIASLKEEYSHIKNKVIGLVNQTFKLPPFPETDTEITFTKIPNHFGSKFDDVEWDRYATEFYSDLKVINKVITYWLELIVHNGSKWEKLTALHLKLMNGECESEEELLQEMRSMQDPSIHFSCKECLNLNPFNLNTGLHFCYFYWIKMMVTSMACYRDLMVYFLKGSTIQNFTKVVRMSGFKNKETGTFCVPHQTSMTMSVCMELNRLRLVCRSPKLWPLSSQAYLYYLNEDMCALEYAKNHTLIRSQSKRRSPMVLALHLASCIRSSQTLPRDVQQLKVTIAKQLEYETLTGQTTTDTLRKQEELSARELEHVSKSLLELVQEQGVISMSVLEELSSGLMWRFNTFWHTSRFDAYLDIILDKIALYYLGFHSSQVMDDPLFRIKVSDDHKKYSIESTQEGLATKLSSLQIGEGETTRIDLTSDTIIMDQSEEGDEIPPITPQTELIAEQQQLGSNFLNTMEKELLSSENYLVNQDFLFYTNSLITEIHLSKYYRNKYAQAQWEFIGESPQEREFKWQYFMAMRALFKYWARHRRVTNTDMLRDTAATKYNRLMTTQCEFNWFKYYTSVTLRDTSKLVSTTNSKLIQVLRPFEKEALSDMAGQEMKVLFDYHRVDPRHRGYGDWLRLMLAGSVFASSIPEFTTEGSKYILQHEQTLSNFGWFQQENFPFIWYWGGRYYVYCNKILWYVFDVPHDLLCRIKVRHQSDSEAYYTKKQLSDDSQKGLESLKLQLEKECSIVNKNNDFDNHAYLGNIEETQPLLYQHLFMSTPPLPSENLSILREDDDDDDDELEAFSNDEDCIWEQYKTNRGTNLADYECISALAMEELEKMQERCLPEADYDNGDTLYDTLALWAFMVQENHALNPKLAKAVMEGIVSSCDILLKKSNGGTQKDLPLLQVTSHIQSIQEMVGIYERNYM